MKRVSVFILPSLLLALGCSTYSNNNGYAADDPLWKAQAQLQAAVFSEDIHEVQKAIDQGANLNMPIGCAGCMGLEGAMFLKNKELFEFLLSKGAVPTHRDTTFAERLEDRWYLEQLNKSPNKNVEATGINSRSLRISVP